MYSLPQLTFDYADLEPHIDAQTMQIHHTKHHQGYTDKFNAAVKTEGLENIELDEILAHVSKYSTAVRNNGGGFYNHSLFWETLAPNAGGEPEGELAEHIAAEFGSFEEFQDVFSQTAATRFGSGWAWLVVRKGELAVGSTANQDNPLMDVTDFSGTPILGLDVWEHAYYLNYQNRRPDYISAFWNVVDWNIVAEKYQAAL